jgi:virulence-associated protein VapD
MIAKLQSISYTQNALSYCEQGGEIIYSNQCLGNSKDIYLQMLENNANNDRCLKQTFHIKIRIAAEDKGKLNIQNWIDISNDYAAKIGFQNNPFAVYIHEEGTEAEHLHIVASRITENNKAVSDGYTHYKNMDFCREIEGKYSLRKVERVLEKVKNNEVFQSSDKRISPLKETIFKAIEMSDTMDDVIFHLKNQGIKVKIGRGIGFTDGAVYFKGSSIDRRLSLKGIEGLLSYEYQQNQQLEQNTQHNTLPSTEQSTEEFNSDLIFDTINNLTEKNSDSNDFEEDTKKRKKRNKGRIL